MLRKTLRGEELKSTAALAQLQRRPALSQTGSLTLGFHPKLKHGLGRTEDTLTVGAVVLHVLHTHCVCSAQHISLNTIAGVGQMCAFPVATALKWKQNVCGAQPTFRTDVLDTKAFFYKYLSQNDIVALGVASKEISLCLTFTI